MIVADVQAPPALKFLEELQPGKPGHIGFFFVSPVGREDTYYRRLIKALGSSWPATLIRPHCNLYNRDLYAGERTAEQIAQAIKETAPSGPFVIVGFCLAGCIAFSAAGRLASSGCVGVMVVDAPMPGYPQFLPTGRSASAYAEMARTLIVSGGGPKRSYAGVLIPQKLLWYAVLVLRPVLQPLQSLRVFRLPANLARRNHNALFRLPRMPLPVLCFVASSPAEPLFPRYACAGWDHIAGAGSRVHVMRCDHGEMFFRGNLPEMAEEVLKWLETLPARARSLRSGG